jgi:hypothetical protein
MKITPDTRLDFDILLIVKSSWISFVYYKIQWYDGAYKKHQLQQQTDKLYLTLIMRIPIAWYASLLMSTISKTLIASAS